MLNVAADTTDPQPIPRAAFAESYPGSMGRHSSVRKDPDIRNSKGQETKKTKKNRE